MSDLPYKLSELRPLLRPLAEYAASPAYFFATRAINQETLYLTALFLVLATDMIDVPRRDRVLLRDFAAGAMTVLLALSINDPLGLTAGGLVAVAAVAGLLVPIYFSRRP